MHDLDGPFHQLSRINPGQQLVQTLKVPSDRAAGPVDVERVLALGPDHRPADLERSARATGELAEHAGVILVGHRRARILRLPPAVMAGILCAAMVYALLNYLLSLRVWAVDVEDEPIPA